MNLKVVYKGNDEALLSDQFQSLLKIGAFGISYQRKNINQCTLNRCR